MGVPPSGSGHSAEPEPVPVSAVPASVLNAVPPVIERLQTAERWGTVEGWGAVGLYAEAAEIITVLLEALEGLVALQDANMDSAMYWRRARAALAKVRDQ